MVEVVFEIWIYQSRMDETTEKKEKQNKLIFTGD